jgi:UDPglucose 6-dehydrogenase
VKIGVVGLGYLGATHSVALAKLGHEVFGVDLDLQKVHALNAGKVPFHEPGLEEALAQCLASKSLKFQNDWAMPELPEVIFICVGTPQGSASGATDMSSVLAACTSLAKVISPQTVLVGKSTVPVGSAAVLRDLMEEVSGFPVHLVWNPEFLREGTALADSLNPDRIVIGSWDDYGREKLKKVYQHNLAGGTPLLEVGVETAELVKVAANAFLATKISFINAMAEIAEVAGADAVDLSKAIGLDERIGPSYLRSGIGFGGGCLPKDIRGLVARAEDLGVGRAVRFLNDVDAINQRRRARVVELAKQELGELADKKILVLGLSFKPDSDDMRDSPALDIALRLASEGSSVSVHDPISIPSMGEKYPELTRREDISMAAEGQDLVVLGTEWDEYKDIDPEEFGQLVSKKLIIDGRNALDVAKWQSAGWRLIALGRNVHQQ